MVHVGGTEGRIGGATQSLVDFNRAGTPLMELVTEPDIRTPEEARRFAQKLRLIFLTLGISRLQHGGRLDARGRQRVHPSAAAAGEEPAELGTKAEIKNMNSFKALHDGLLVRDRPSGRGARRRRRRSCRRRGTGTRRRSARARCAARRRRTTTATSPSPTWCRSSSPRSAIERDPRALPELPDARKARFMADYGLPVHDAAVLTEDLRWRRSTRRRCLARAPSAPRRSPTGSSASSRRS